MSNSEQNKFYTSISRFYSEIFPYKPMQLKFVQSEMGDLTRKSILDIGCATGELAFQLAKAGAKVTGIDLNEDLLDQARKGICDLQSPKKKTRLNNASPIPIFRVSNMLELKNDFQKEQFDAVLCFGNTLVHLPTMELINQTLQGVNYVLKPGDKFFLQMLNYDYILDEKVTELPVIETENIRFVRKYKFRENSSLIQFKTDLHIKKRKQNHFKRNHIAGIKKL